MLRPDAALLSHTTEQLVHNARRLRRVALPGVAVALITVLSGGFVAGNGAGWAYNTWPKMNYDWVPEEVGQTFSNLRANYKDLFESTPVVQFDHRILAYSTVLASWAVHLAIWCRENETIFQFSILSI